MSEGTPKQQPINNFQCAIGGEAGFGVIVIGQMFAKLCSRNGRWTFEYPEYPSLINGGHNVDFVLVSEQPVYAPLQEIHLLIALNQETIDLHRAALVPGAAIIFDPDQVGVSVAHLKDEGFRLYPVPLEKLAHEAGGEETRNVVAFGVCAGLLNADRSALTTVLRDTFGTKNERLFAKDLKAATLGYDYAEKQFSQDFPWVLPPANSPQRLNLTGNVAIALGAIKAGCKLYVAYPMTPSTTILSYLAKVGERYGMVVRHAEDEIGVINSAIGAGYMGVRTMVGTSGGGFSLMVEGVGLAAMLEVPIVIVEAQRPGPATGLPTWTGQADLQFVLHAAQGEFPRVILAPGDVGECFSLAFHAFNLAEKYQTPVFLLTDKFLGESAATTEPFQTSSLRYDRGAVDRNPKEDANGLYPRYRWTDSGVSPRTIPGTPGGVHLANSDEHDAYGLVDETSENRVIMSKKRLQKLTGIVADLPLPVFYGPKEANLTLVTWGSTKGPAIDALRMLTGGGYSVNLLHFSCIFPLDVARVEAQIRSCKNVMVVEGNATGQFAEFLKAQVGLLPEATFRKDDGRPFFPAEIANEAARFLATL